MNGADGYSLTLFKFERTVNCVVEYEITCIFTVVDTFTTGVSIILGETNGFVNVIVAAPFISVVELPVSKRNGVVFAVANKPPEIIKDGADNDVAMYKLGVPNGLFDIPPPFEYNTDVFTLPPIDKFDTVNVLPDNEPTLAFEIVNTFA